ncbi:MAG: ferritin family protein [Kiritimatiellae bacterium]|nr:ferritin family protein [Kiritimatiellia bacterium]
MGLMFNIDEVFAMAIQIEDNAALFYREAVRTRRGRQRDEAAFLEELASMEDEHRKTFYRMREAAAQHTKVPGEILNEEGALYLAAIAGGYPVEGSPMIMAKLRRDEPLPAILQTAIELEKKSILFYVELRDLVRKKAEKNLVSAIIGQEKQHVVELMKRLESVSKA